LKHSLRWAATLVCICVALYGARGSKAFASPEKVLPDGTHLVTLSVPEMECSMCSRSISSELKRLSGVLEVKLDEVNRQATVKFDASQVDLKKIQAAVRRAGFTSKPVEPPK